MILHRAPLSELMDSIVSLHHDYLRRSLPRLASQLARTPPGPGVLTARRLLEAFATELEEHIFREEQILFPAIRELESEGHRRPLEQAVRQMHHEHEATRQSLRNLRATVETISSEPALLMAVEDVEYDLYRHFRLEEEVLFPRAQALLG